MNGLKEIKKQMTEYRDLFGGDLLRVSEIKSAKTKKELSEIIDNHIAHIESMSLDAIRGVEEFKKDLGLNEF